MLQCTNKSFNFHFNSGFRCCCCRPFLKLFKSPYTTHQNITITINYYTVLSNRFLLYKFVFQGPVLQGNSTSISGLISVAKAITKKSCKNDLFGANELDKAEVDQWLYYCNCQYLNDKPGSLKV